MTCAEISSLIELTPLLADDMGGATDLLQDAELQALDEHLADCAGCRAKAEAMNDAYAQWGEAREHTMKPLSKTLRERVLADRLAETKTKTGGVVAADPPVDQEAIDAVRAKVVLSCSFCHDGMEREASVFCASCLAPHHAECFSEHGACSMPGCDETRTVRPSQVEPPSKRSGRGWVKAGLVVSLGTLVGGMAALTTRPPSPAVLGPPAVAPDVVEVSDDPPFEAVVTEEPFEDEDEDEGRFVDVAPLQEGPATTPINIDVDGASLGSAMRQITAQSGLHVVVAPDVKETVRVSLRRISAGQCVDVIARMVRCEVKILAGGVRYLHQPPRVTLQFDDASVRTLLRLVARSSGKSVFVGPGVGGTMDVDLLEVHWKHAIDAIVKGADLSVAWSGEVALVTAKASPVTSIPAARAQTLTLEPDEKATPISLEAKNLGLADLCDQIGRQAGVNVLVDPSLVETVSVVFKGLAWHDAITALAHLTGTEVERRSGGLVLLASPPEVSLNVSQAPAAAVYRMLARRAGKSVTVHESVGGALSGVANGIHYQHALECLAALHGHRVKQEAGGVINVLADKPQGKLKPADPLDVTALVVASGAEGGGSAVLLNGLEVMEGQELAAGEADGRSVKVVTVTKTSAVLRVNGKKVLRELP